MGDFISGDTPLPDPKTDVTPPSGLSYELDASDINNAYDALGDIRDHVGGWVNPASSAYGAVMDDVTNDAAALALALADAIAKGYGLIIPGKLRLDSGTINISVPILFMGTGSFDLQSGSALTISGGFNLTQRQIFYANGGTLSITAKLPYVTPKWWGAAGDGVSNDSAAFTAAFAAAASSGAEVRCDGATYLLNASSTSSNVRLVGAGRERTILKPYSLSSPVLQIGDGAVTTVSYWTVAHLSFQSGGSGASSDGVLVYGAGHVAFVDVRWNAFGRDNVRLETSQTVPVFSVHFSNCVSENARGSGLKTVYLPSGTSEWVASHTYSVGDKVMHGGYIYACTTGGAAASSYDASWSVVIGATGVVDNVARWTCTGLPYVTAVTLEQCFFTGYASASAYSVYTDAEIKVFGTWLEIPASSQGGLLLKQWKASAGIPSPHFSGLGVLDSGNSSDILVTIDKPSPATTSSLPGFDAINNHITGQFTIDGYAKWVYTNQNAAAWQATHAYSLGDIVLNGTKYYCCSTAGTSAGSGGPTGNGIGITDNTAVWGYCGSLTTNCTGGDSFVYYKGRHNYPDVTGSLTFYTDEADVAAGTGTRFQRQGAAGGGNEYLSHDHTLRTTGTRAYPLQFSVNGSLWRGTNKQIYFARDTWWPSADSDGNPLGELVAKPSTKTDTGSKGQYAVESGWLYVCIATNTWQRVAIADW